jgi:hypothetical protein
MMRPRRSVFATSYIDQAVVGLKTASACDDRVLVRWAHDVLAEYFAVTRPDPATDGARLAFAEISLALAESGEPDAEASVPYVLKKRQAVTIDQFRQLARNLQRGALVPAADLRP